VDASSARARQAIQRTGIQGPPPRQHSLLAPGGRPRTSSGNRAAAHQTAAGGVL
jgi:hypothetical protein